MKEKTGYQVGHRLIIRDIARFEALVAANVGKNSMELIKLWDEQVSCKSVLRLLKKLGYSYKKTFVHPKREDGSRNEFIAELKKFSCSELVFLDESGIEDNASPLYSWSIKGAATVKELISVTEESI